MKPMRNNWSTVCSGVDVAVVASIGVAGGKLGDAGGNKVDRSRLAKLRTLTKRGKSLEDWIAV